jgi:hypothetical protein
MNIDNDAINLEILNERDAVPYDECSGFELENAITLEALSDRRISFKSLFSDQMAPIDIPSWLEEDDIEE